MSNLAQELALDIDAEGAGALHRVVRAMHDGYCPKCGYLAGAHRFVIAEPVGDEVRQMELRHQCPACGFTITKDEAEAALALFQPIFSKSVEVFEQWRQNRGK